MQVINRDLSVAVLRYFVEQRRQEINDGVLKAPRQKRTPAEAAQLKESGGTERSSHLPPTEYAILNQRIGLSLHSSLHSYHICINGSMVAADKNGDAGCLSGM